MNDRTPEHPSSEQAPVFLDEDVAGLVRAAGPREKMRPEGLERMQEELRPLWGEQVDANSSSRPRLRLLAAAALLALTTAAIFLTRSTQLQEPVRFASVARQDGVVSAWGPSGAEATENLTFGAVLETGQSVATGDRGRVALLAVSGHSVRLDHDTRVVLVSEREVRLEQGAIYVDSGGDPTADSGMSVLTALGRVTEIGTQFEVRLAADSVKVRVREGEVLVGSPGSGHRGVAGEELTISTGSVVRRVIDRYSGLFDWTQEIAPPWILSKSRLADFLGFVARESGLSLEYAEYSLAQEATNIVLHGDLTGLTPLESLEVVLPAVGYSQRIESGKLIISRLDEETDRR